MVIKNKKRRGKIDLEALQAGDKVFFKEELGDFRKCLQLFLDELEIKNLSWHTRRWHRENLTAVEKVLNLKECPTEPQKITSKMIKECILFWKREMKLAPTTINHRLRSLKQFYEFLSKEKIVDNSPMEEIEKQKTPKTIIRPFEESDLKKLFNQPDKSTFVGFRDFTMMLVFLDTGVRLIEMVGMKVIDVDMKNNTILVLGKGAKEREVIFQKTTKEYLKRYLMLRGEVDHDYLWVNDNNNPMTRRNIEERLKIYGEKAGLTQVRVSPHTFRHTCAKLYILRGGDILSLQKLLGHSTLDMVRHYVNLWGTDLQHMHRRYSPVEGLFGHN